jgi:hypothetical protein
MLVLGPLLVLAAIGFFCWLLFTLAAFALPFFVGLTVGMWAFHTGAGALGGIIVGVVAGGATFGLGQIAMASFRRRGSGWRSFCSSSRPLPSPATAPRMGSLRSPCHPPPGRWSSR